MNIIWTLVILGVMIFVHELGHFIAARIFSVNVEEFAMGMGPAIFKKQGDKTLYSIRLLPLGGYCKMEGEDEDTDSPGSLNGVHPLKRLIILLAGAFMNVLLAFVLFIVISFGSGNYYTSTFIGGFTEDAPMEVFEVGDKIVKINSAKINIFEDITLEMFGNRGESVDITVERNGEFIKKTITPYKTETGYKLGFYAEVKEKTFADAIRNGFYNTVFSIKSVYWSIEHMIKGTIGLESVSGPVGMAGVVDDVITEAEKSGAYYVFLNIIYLMAVIGANLGVMNLLPFPALDGGRIVFTFFELVTRKKVPGKVEGAIHAAGFILLMLFALFITWSDITKLLG